MWGAILFFPPLCFSGEHLGRAATAADLFAAYVQERDTARQQADELLEVNMTLETEIRHCGSVPAAVHRGFLQSEPDFEEEMRELIGQCAGLLLPSFFENVI